MELDLNNLPTEIAAIKATGNMIKMFKTIYQLCSNKAPTNSSNSNENDSGCSLFLIMPTGERLPFEATSMSIKLLPGGIIELDVREKKSDIYLAHVKKSNTISGKAATNYAIIIASLLGASTLSISDSAFIKCNDGLSTFPLSFYRLLTSPDKPSIGWYENVARARGLSVNNKRALRLGFYEAAYKLRAFETKDLIAYYSEVKVLFETKPILKQQNHYIDYDRQLTSHAVEIIEDKYKGPIIEILSKLISSLGASKSSTLSEFLKEIGISCSEKSLLLRSLPGFNSHLISVPVTVYDEKEVKILEFPNLVDFLIVKTTGLGYKIKLKGGMTVKKRRLNLTRRI